MGMLRQLAQRLSNRDMNNGTRWIVEVENNIDLTLTFYKRKEAEVYRKALRLSTANLKSTIRKIVLNEGYIRT